MGSKTSYNGSNKALFESKIQTKKQYSLRAVEQGSLFLWIVQKSKENKGNLTILYFYLEKWTKIWCQKGLFYSFCSKKVTFLGSLRAKYNSKWMKISNCYALKLWHYYRKTLK